MKSLFFILFILSVSICNSQTFKFDGSIATDSKGAIFIYNLNPGVGYSFIDRDYFFGGVKYQNYSLIPKGSRNEDDTWSTTTISNFMFQAGFRYYIPICRPNKNTEKEMLIGFFPECSLYFNPFVPRKIKYIDNNGQNIRLVGNYRTQFPYGIGIGIFFKRIMGKGLIAFNFEYSTIDAFRTLRDLDYKNKEFNFPDKSQYSIGISISR